MSFPANLAELGFAHVLEPGEGAWTLLLLHGTGGDEHDLVGLGRQLAPRAALLSPRGRTLENGMPRFFRRLAVGKLDIPDLLRRTDELASFVAAAAATYKLDPGRVVALGLSNGANIAVSLLLRHPGLLCAAALLRPMLPYEPEDVPQLTGTEVLIAAGEGDPYSSPEQTERLGEILSAGGAAVETHTEPGAGHGLTQGDLRRLADWIARVTTEDG
jgi:phospholipase/carboxylesterase/glyoxalase family protein